MKKTLKIVGIIALILFSVFFLVCIYAFPNETQEYVKNAWSFINQPLPIVGVSAVVLACTIVKIVSMTSFGNKKLNELKKKHDEWVDESKKVETKEKEMLEETKSVKAEAELMLANFGNNQDELIKFIYDLCKTIPNAKVNALCERLMEIAPLTLEEAKQQAEETLEENADGDEAKETDTENMGLGNKG